MVFFSLFLNKNPVQLFYTPSNEAMFSCWVKARSVINFLVNLGRFYINSKNIKSGEVKKCLNSCTFNLCFLIKGTQLQIRIAKKPQETSKLWSYIYSNVKGSFSILGKDYLEGIWGQPSKL